MMTEEEDGMRRLLLVMDGCEGDGANAMAVLADAASSRTSDGKKYIFVEGEWGRMTRGQQWSVN